MSTAAATLKFPKLWQRDLRAVIVLRVSDAISPRIFSRQLSLLNTIGRIVSLDDVREGRGLGRVSFVLLLAHPTSRTQALLEGLDGKDIPAAMAVFAAADGGQSRGAGAAGLSLVEIARLTASRPWLTIVNHGEHWHSLDVPGHVAAMDDVARSSDRCAQAFQMVPRYYAVPCGVPCATLAVDVVEALRTRDYSGALWSLPGANLVRGPAGHRLLNLGWIDAPHSTSRMSAAITAALRRSHEGVVAALPAGEMETEWTIQIGGPPSRALAFDNVMRESREYASNPDVFDYQFTQNPYKGTRADYHAVVAGGRITSIGYNFHARFMLDGRPLDAVYWSSWRKLEASPRAASALLLAQAVSAEPIVGAYHPSASAQQALRTRSWKHVRVIVCTLRIASLTRRASHAAAGAVTIHERYPSSIDDVVAAARERYRFSIERTPDFYRWRYDRYPLAEARYFVQSIDGAPVAYAVTLRRGTTMSVSDFFAPTVGHFESLIAAIVEACRTQSIATLVVETSLPEIERQLRAYPDARIAEALNFYHFNKARLQRAGFQAPLDEWDSMTFHETQASGDVLLR